MEISNGSRWVVQPSEFSARVFNPIRSIVDTLKKPENPPKEIIPLSLGDPTVFGNLAVPTAVVRAVTKSLESGKFNGYGHSTGLPAAREAIAAYSTLSNASPTAADVFITNGCSEALEFALAGILNEGDNVLLPRPGFAVYEVIARSRGAECRFYDLLPEKQWEADLDQLRSQIDSRTKLLVVNNPSNPCGSVYSKEHLRALLSVAEENFLPILSDEIYGDMTFGSAKFIPLASLTETVPVIAAGGMAKKFVVPGWRVGWLVLYDRNGALSKVREAFASLAMVSLGPNTVIQGAIPDILTPEPESKAAVQITSFYRQYIKTLEENAKLTVDQLGKVDCLRVVVPQGTMYAMVGIDTSKLKDVEDDKVFAQKLLAEECVVVLPGECFRMPGYFRVVYAAPAEKLTEAYERIGSFCERHHV